MTFRVVRAGHVSVIFANDVYFNLVLRSIGVTDKFTRTDKTETEECVKTSG